MRQAARLLLVLSISVASLVTGTGTAFGCSCMMPNAQDLFAGADGVFVGTLQHRPSDVNIGVTSSADPIELVFSVVDAYKGEIEDPMLIMTAISGASCGIEMAEGSSALLFVDLIDGEWHGNLCATMGAEAQAELGVPEIPFAKAGGDDATTMARWVLAGVILVAIAGFGLSRRDKGEGPDLE